MVDGGRGFSASLGSSLAALLLTVAPAATVDDSIVVGSKNFTENRILAEVFAGLLEEHTELHVEVLDGLGGTKVAFDALLAGDIDVYPEYTGTGWAIVLKQSEPARDPMRTYLHVAREYDRRFGITWCDPLGFSNSYALAVRTELAESRGLRRVSDLRPLADELTFGFSHEFLEREDGWPGLRAAYDLDAAEVRGMDHGLAFESIDDGEIDVIDAWTTDGKLLRFDVTVLEDDLGFWPPYDCAPIVRNATLARHPELRDVFEKLAFRLDAARMQALNLAVEEEGRSFRDVARSFLREEGLIGPATGAAATRDGAAAGERRGDLLEFARGRLGATADLTGRHLLLTAGSVLAAALVSIPLGILLARRRRWAGPILGAAGVIQTVPSLALLAFMIPVLGLGLDAAYAALILYALLPVLRNTYAGILEVDADLVEAAHGIGLTPGQVLWRVELPLAARTIMAGVRTATVITIGVATLAAFIGAGGLGEPIVTGLQLNDTRLVLAGAVPAALLALLADGLLGWVERRLTPGVQGSGAA